MSTPGRVMVTGAGGFIGSYLVADLVAAGWEVHGIGRRAPTTPGLSGAHAFDLLGDDVDDLLATIRPTHLAHLAWTTDHGAFWNDPANLLWVSASLSLLHAFHAAGGQRALMVGSCTEYDWSELGPYSESETGAAPHTLYGSCKRAAGVAALAFGQTHGPEIAWARIFHLYGPGEDGRRIVPLLIDAARRAKPLGLQQPDQTIDVLHVRDVAGALGAVLESSFVGPCNIASGSGVTIRQLAEEIEALSGTRCYRDEHAGHAPSAAVVADTSRLRNEIGFEARYTLTKGLQETRRQFLAATKGATA